jgi:hypothetical protein
MDNQEDTLFDRAFVLLDKCQKGELKSFGLRWMINDKALLVMMNNASYFPFMGIVSSWLRFIYNIKAIWKGEKNAGD